MAYNKKYAELGESVIDYVNNRDDAIKQGFDTLITGGTNSDGSWIKFPDGTMICWHNISLGDITSLGKGTWEDPYRTPASVNVWNFPMSFISRPQVHAQLDNQIDTWHAKSAFVSFVRPGTHSVRGIQAIRPNGASTSAIIDCSLIAIGRWK